MKGIGHLHYCLGIEFIQKKYIDAILCKFKMQDSKVLTTPLDNNVKFIKDMCP